MHKLAAVPDIFSYSFYFVRIIYSSQYRFQARPRPSVLQHICAIFNLQRNPEESKSNKMHSDAASMVMQIEDVARKILYRSSASAVIRIAGTCRANFALAREEALWEHLFVRSGMRFRPPGWATASSAGYEDELMPDSWRLAFRDCLKLTIPASRGRRLRISSGGLTIQQALELAKVGDVLELAPGFYPPIIVSKAVTIVGLNRDCVEIEGVKIEADGVTIASLTILGKHLDVGSTSDSSVELLEESSAVTVSAKNVRITDCSIRGDQGIDVREGICQVLTCDILVRHCCFWGSGELTCCRLEDQSQHLQSHNLHGRRDYSIVSFRQGNNAVTNCLVDGSNIGVRVERGAYCHVADSVITANAYGISVQGSQNSPSSSRLLLENSRYYFSAHAPCTMRSLLHRIPLEILSPLPSRTRQLVKFPHAIRARTPSNTQPRL